VRKRNINGNVRRIWGGGDTPGTNRINATGREKSSNASEKQGLSLRGDRNPFKGGRKDQVKEKYFNEGAKNKKVP